MMETYRKEDIRRGDIYYSRLLGIDSIDEYIAMAGRCGPVSLLLMMKMSTPRTPPSGMMSPHGGTSIQRSAKTFSIPWLAMRQADISAICTLCMRPVS